MLYNPQTFQKEEKEIKFNTTSVLDEAAADKAYNFMLNNLDIKAEYEEKSILLDLYTKHYVAKLSNESTATSDAARTKDAHADEKYLKHIENLAYATARFNKFKDLYKIAQSRIDMWRTKEASSRI